MAKPKLRFPEFTDEWNEKTLDKLFEYKNGDSLENSLDENGNYYLISLNSIDKNGNLQNKLKRVINAKWFLKKNDIVMVLSDIGKGNFLGLSEIIPEDNKYVLNQRMGLLRAKAEINITYARAYINFSQKYFKSCGQGSAQLNISKGDVLKFVLKIPCIKEQQKIADFLSKVDKKIANQEAVISDYEEMKKGLMQKIFSQEVRFKADDGSDYLAWKTRIMKDCLKYEQPTKYIVSSEKYNDSYETPVLTANKGFVLGYTDDKDGIYDKGNVIIYDDFTMDAKYVNFNFKVKSSAIKILTEREGINLYFIFLYLQNLKLQQAEHARSYISKIEPMSINIPCLEEQQKIADCLSTMDRKIEAEKKILEDWKELKKALLQQMFV